MVVPKEISAPNRVVHQHAFWEVGKVWILPFLSSGIVSFSCFVESKNIFIKTTGGWIAREFLTCNLEGWAVCGWALGGLNALFPHWRFVQIGIYVRTDLYQHTYIFILRKNPKLSWVSQGFMIPPNLRTTGLWGVFSREYSQVNFYRKSPSLWVLWFSDTSTLPSGLSVLCSHCVGFPGLVHSCIALGNWDAHTEVEQLSVVVERFLGSVRLAGQSWLCSRWTTCPWASLQGSV